MVVVHAGGPRLSPAPPFPPKPGGREIPRVLRGARPSRPPPRRVRGRASGASAGSEPPPRSLPAPPGAAQRALTRARPPSLPPSLPRAAPAASLQRSRRQVPAIAVAIPRARATQFSLAQLLLGPIAAGRKRKPSKQRCARACQKKQMQCDVRSLHGKTPSAGRGLATRRDERAAPSVGRSRRRPTHLMGAALARGARPPPTNSKFRPAGDPESGAGARAPSPPRSSSPSQSVGSIRLGCESTADGCGRPIRFDGRPTRDTRRLCLRAGPCVLPDCPPVGSGCVVCIAMT